MELKAKERIVFDENPYYGGEGEEMAVEDLMSRDGLTEDAVRESYTDSEIFNHAMEMKNFDYDEEMGQLKDFFDGTHSYNKEHNPNWGNHILVRGSTQTYFGGVRTGISPYKDFDAATDCSPSRFGSSNIFADCEIQKVWDENGTLHLSGAHHDGGVSVEMRQLTDEGEKLYSEWLLDGEELYLPEDGFSAMGKSYRDGDENQFVLDLWESPEMCAAPRYAEKAFGCPTEEYEMQVSGTRTDSFAVSKNEEGGYDVIHSSYGMPIDGYRADSLADARGFCERHVNYLSEQPEEDVVSLSGESRDMRSSRDGLAGNQTELEEKAAECREAASALSDKDAL